eukprot:TRINITY_DN8452_c0_g1_i4.p1 TRINITY_DN8452_c0_g1~~TRINITY_DN8452_c0_g1_i4.p1  ORF type:complete len:533 (+),score=108.21 TRINITY_DN8452_c0_g1_i4:106-1704(+)
MALQMDHFDAISSEILSDIPLNSLDSPYSLLNDDGSEFSTSSPPQTPPDSTQGDDSDDAGHSEAGVGVAFDGLENPLDEQLFGGDIDGVLLPHLDEPAISSPAQPETTTLPATTTSTSTTSVSNTIVPSTTMYQSTYAQPVNASSPQGTRYIVQAQPYKAVYPTTTTTTMVTGYPTSYGYLAPNPTNNQTAAGMMKPNAPKRKRKPKKEADPARLSPQEQQELQAKKERRMQKNRESASASRRRKKEYLEGLEKQVRDRTEENAALKQRVQVLESEIKTLRHESTTVDAFLKSQPYLLSQYMQWRSRSPSVSTATTSLMMVTLLCFAFVAFPGVGLGNDNQHTQLSAPMRQSAPGFRSRTLASVPLLSHVVNDKSADPTRVYPLGRANLNPKSLPPAGMDKLMYMHKQALKEQLIDKRDVSQNQMTVHPEHTAMSMLKMGELERQAMLQPTVVRRKSDTSYIFCTEVQIMSALDGAEEGVRPRLSLIVPTTTEKQLHSKLMTPAASTHQFWAMPTHLTLLTILLSQSLVSCR